LVDDELDAEPRPVGLRVATCDDADPGVRGFGVVAEVAAAAGVGVVVVAAAGVFFAVVVVAGAVVVAFPRGWNACAPTAPIPQNEIAPAMHHRTIELTPKWCHTRRRDPARI
jgi:hypothetical protein